MDIVYLPNSFCLLRIEVAPPLPIVIFRLSHYRLLSVKNEQSQLSRLLVLDYYKEMNSS